MKSSPLFSFLAVLQAILVVSGWIASLGDIQRIVFVGPALSAFGLLIAVMAWFRRRLIGVTYGLGVPTLSIISFLLIYLLKWSPGDAYYPINSLIAVFAIVSAPWCVFAIRESAAEVDPTAKPRFQFSIGGIMLLTFFLACTLGLQKAFGFEGIILGVLLWYVIVAAWLVSSTLRGIKATDAVIRDVPVASVAASADPGLMFHPKQSSGSD